MRLTPPNPAYDSEDLCDSTDGAVGCVRTGSDSSSLRTPAGRVRIADIHLVAVVAAFFSPAAVACLHCAFCRMCTFVESKGERQRSHMTDRRRSAGSQEGPVAAAHRRTTSG